MYWRRAKNDLGGSVAYSGSDIRHLIAGFKSNSLCDLGSCTPVGRKVWRRMYWVSGGEKSRAIQLIQVCGVQILSWLMLEGRSKRYGRVGGCGTWGYFIPHWLRGWGYTTRINNCGGCDYDFSYPCFEELSNSSAVLVSLKDLVSTYRILVLLRLGSIWWYQESSVPCRHNLQKQNI